MSGDLDHSPADVLQQLLIDLGYVTDISAGGSWPCYSGNHPDTPDNSVCVYSTESKLGGREHVQGEMAEHYGTQIRVRSNGENGFTKAMNISQGLDKTVNRTSVEVGSAIYTVNAITRTSGVLSLGYEHGSSRRKLWTVNALMSLTMTVPGTGT